MGIIRGFTKGINHKPKTTDHKPFYMPTANGYPPKKPYWQQKNLNLPVLLKHTNMKKVIALLSIAVCFTLNTAMAQGGGGQQTPEQRAARMKERLKDVGLSDVQMDSVIAISGEFQPKTMEIFRDQNMSQEDKMAKGKEITDARNKRLEKALPAELAKKVIEALAPRQGGGGRPGGGQR